VNNIKLETAASTRTNKQKSTRKR